MHHRQYYDKDQTYLDYCIAVLDENNEPDIYKVNSFTPSESLTSGQIEFYEDDIRDNPESYFDDDDFQLTDEQEKRVDRRLFYPVSGLCTGSQ